MYNLAAIAAAVLILIVSIRLGFSYLKYVGTFHFPYIFLLRSEVARERLSAPKPTRKHAAEESVKEPETPVAKPEKVVKTKKASAPKKKAPAKDAPKPAAAKRTASVKATPAVPVPLTPRRAAVRSATPVRALSAVRAASPAKKVATPAKKVATPKTTSRGRAASKSRSASVARSRSASRPARAAAKKPVSKK